MYHNGDSSSTHIMINNDNQKNCCSDMMSPWINKEELPSYSTERFFVLREMEQHAHSLKYLSEELSDNDDDIEHEQ